MMESKQGLINQRMNEALQSVQGDVETSELVAYLGKIGLLGAISKMMKDEKEGVAVDSESVMLAAASMREVTDDLTKPQAMVVTRMDAKGIDITKYVDNNFSDEKMCIIGEALQNNEDVSNILNSEFSAAQMLTLLQLQRTGMDVKPVSHPKIPPSVMLALARGIKMGLDMTDVIALAEQGEYSSHNAWVEIDHIITLKFLGYDIKPYLDEVEKRGINVLPATDSVTECLIRSDKGINACMTTLDNLDVKTIGNGAGLGILKSEEVLATDSENPPVIGISVETMDGYYIDLKVLEQNKGKAVEAPTAVTSAPTVEAVVEETEEDKTAESDEQKIRAANPK